MKTRLIIWVAICLMGAIVFFGEVWARIPEWLSPEGLRRYGTFHWGVLGLCTLWLWLKRRDILPRMRQAGFSLPFVVAGVALLALSILLPRSDYFLVFLLLLGWLGVFAILFGRAGIIPSMLLAIYGFSLVFPLLVTRWLGEPSSLLVASMVITINQMLGLPVANQGQALYFTAASGDAVSTTVSADCAGYATMGVFIALFALMMLDIRLPLKRAWLVFLFGLAGTWLQNIVRIEASVAAGYYWGPGALEATHQNIAYFIFPLWYALFAFIYLKEAGWRSLPPTK